MDGRSSTLPAAETLAVLLSDSLVGTEGSLALEFPLQEAGGEEAAPRAVVAPVIAVPECPLVAAAWNHSFVVLMWYQPSFV